MEYGERAMVMEKGFDRASAESMMRATLIKGKIVGDYWATRRENARLRLENERLQRLVDSYRAHADQRYASPPPDLSWIGRACRAGVYAAIAVLVVGGAIGWCIGWI